MKLDKDYYLRVAQSNCFKAGIRIYPALVSKNKFFIAIEHPNNPKKYDKNQHYTHKASQLRILELYLELDPGFL